MEPCPRCRLTSPHHAPGCPVSGADLDRLAGSQLEVTAILTSDAGIGIGLAPPLPEQPRPVGAEPPPEAPVPSGQAERQSQRSPRPGDLPTGTLVGEYRITGVLGRGGMGTVYAGVHPVIGKRVAIKVLLAALSVERSALERFQREAQAVNRIGHPSVVDVFAFGVLAEPPGAPYLIMELLDGQSLGQRLRKGPLGLAQVRDIFLQILDGLQAAHEVGVVHRDLKPDNIMLTRRGEHLQVKILDFGIAKLVDDDQPALTRSGIALGTPAYMSPEQALGRPITPATDLYAVAVMLYLCATARPPFLSTSSFEVQRQHVTQPPDPPSRYADMPAELEALILRGMAKSPTDRFPSAGAMADALRAVPAGELSRHGEPGGAASWSAAASAAPARTPAGTPSGSITLRDIARRHLRRLVVVYLAPDVSGCPEAVRPLGEAVEESILTRLCELAEVDIIRPHPQTTAPGRLRGEAAARASGADLYLEITLSAAAATPDAALRANLRIGNITAEEAPFSARVSTTVGEVFQLEDLIFPIIHNELKQRARGHVLRVHLIDGTAALPAQRALYAAEQAYTAPWDTPAAIEAVVRATDQALAIDPDYGEAFYRRGTARMWLSASAGGPAGDAQLDLAIDDLTEAQRRLPNFGPAALYLSMARAIHGQVGAALRAVDQAAALIVTRPGMRTTDALVSDITLSWPRLLATVLPGDPLYADQGLPLLVLGRVLLAVGRLDDAEAVARRLLPIEEADAQATRTGQRRTMRTLPLYGPALILAGVLLRRGLAAEALGVLREERARLSNCEHVTAPAYQLIGLRLLLQATRDSGATDRLAEVQAAAALLSRRLLGDDPEVAHTRAARLFGFFWTPGCHSVPAAPAAAPAWRHYLTALFAVRNGDPRLAQAAAEQMRAAARDAVESADAELLRQHVDAIAAL